MSLRSLWLLVLVLLTSLAGACSSKSASVGGGSAEVVASTSSALTAADVTSVVVTITAPDIPTPIVQNLTLTGGSWRGTIGGIPVGPSRTFSAQAFNAAGALIFATTGNPPIVADITAGGTAAVILTLQQTAAPSAFFNAAPVIDSIVASTTNAAEGASVAIAVTAHDPDLGDTIQYAWTANGGSFTNASAATTSWIAPVIDGSYSLTISVSDTHGASAGMSFVVNVAAGNAQGSSGLTVTFNMAPVISMVSAAPTSIDVGQTTLASVTATDPDGNPLSYSWSSSCAGTFGSASSATTAFTLAAPLASASCALHVDVSDGLGGTNNGTIVIATGPAAAFDVAPQILTTFQSSPTAIGNDVLSFSVVASDPENNPLTFAWSTNVGTLGVQTDSAGGAPPGFDDAGVPPPPGSDAGAPPPSTTQTTSQITWTAPPCFTAGVTPTITLTVTESTGPSTSISFTVTPDPSAVCGAGGAASAIVTFVTNHAFAVNMTISGPSGFPTVHFHYTNLGNPGDLNQDDAAPSFRDAIDGLLGSDVGVRRFLASQLNATLLPSGDSVLVTAGSDYFGALGTNIKITIDSTVGNPLLDGVAQSSTFLSFGSPAGAPVGVGAAPLAGSVVSTLAGRGVTGLSGFADGTGPAAVFANPGAIVADNAGNVFVADSGNNRIRKVTSAGVVTTLAGSGVAAFADGTGAAASFNLPLGIAVDASGNVFVGDCQNNRIRRMTPAGVVTTFAGSGNPAWIDATGTAASFHGPAGLAFDKAGNLAVADIGNHRIRIVSPAGVVTTLAGSGNGAWVDGTGASASFNFPEGVAVGSTGNVYVADTANQRIRVVTPAGVVSTLAGSGVNAFADGTGAAASFFNPIQLAIDPNDVLYVADESNNRIRRVTTGGVVTTAAGTGANVDVDGPAGASSFAGPAGLSIDASQTLFVADSGRIREISPPGTGRLQVSWSAAPPPVTGYAAVASATGFPTGTCISTSLGCTISGLASGIPYSVTVFASTPTGAIASSPTTATPN